jgi:hypothetical protein
LGTSPSFLQIRYARLQPPPAARQSARDPLPAPPARALLAAPAPRVVCLCCRPVSLPAFVRLSARTVTGVRSSVRRTCARVFVAFSSLCRFLCDCCSLPFKYSMKCQKGVCLLILHVRCFLVFVDHPAFSLCQSCMELLCRRTNI